MWVRAAALPGPQLFHLHLRLCSPVLRRRHLRPFPPCRAGVTLHTRNPAGTSLARQPCPKANAPWPSSSTSRTWPWASRAAATASTSTASSSGWSRRARSSPRRPTPTGAASRTYTAPLHEAAIELIEIPRRGQTGKNSADIRLCVDAMDLAYSKDHIDTFVIVSGDSDFSPLVSKLKENWQARHRPGHAGVDLRPAARQLRRVHLLRGPRQGADADARPSTPQLPETKRKAFALLLESLLALRRENKEVLWSSMIKDTMKRKKPSFNETYHGYRTFSELLEDAQKEGLLELETDKRSRTYVVTRFGAEMHHEAAPSSGGTIPAMPLPSGCRRAGAVAATSAVRRPAAEPRGGRGRRSAAAAPRPRRRRRGQRQRHRAQSRRAAWWSCR